MSYDGVLARKEVYQLSKHVDCLIERVVALEDLVYRLIRRHNELAKKVCSPDWPHDYYVRLPDGG